VLVAASALVYVPMALAFTPWAWSDSGFFSLQFCRPLHYAVYFVAGVSLGVAGMDHGLLSIDGPLARRWAFWLTAALGTLALWMGLTAPTMDGEAAFALRSAAALAFVVACAAGCFFFIAVNLRFARKPSPILWGLSANAYGLYLVHYDFVVWLQYALLAVSLYAVIKFAIVFAATLILSLITVSTVQRYSFGAHLIGIVRRSATA
jgi:surface polysaccharide O-acyltransferase-like enzyme